MTPSSIAELVQRLAPEDRAALLVEIVTTIARQASPVAEQPTAPAEVEEPWPHAMRIDRAVEYTGYSDDHLRRIANAGRAGHRIDGDPTSNAPWVFMRHELDRVLREDRAAYAARRADLMSNKRGRHPRRAAEVDAA